METVIRPTGTCFDDALDTLAFLLIETPSRQHTLCLVHGICLAPDGNPYAHAWLEEGEDVLFVGLLHGDRGIVTCDRAAYYADAQVQEVMRYTPRQAWAMNKATNHYGPWLARYQALCVPRGATPQTWTLGSEDN